MKRITVSKFVLVIALAAIGAMGTGFVSGQASEPAARTTHVDFPANAFKLIRERYGVPVSFEDVSRFDYAA